MRDEDFGFYYRYYDILKTSGYFSSDGDYFSHKPETKIELALCPITKKTPKGAFIRNPLTREVQFVADYWRNKYAWPTEDQAKLHYIKRKKHQHLIHEEKSLRAREAYHQAVELWGQESEIKKAATLAKVYGPDPLKVDFGDDAELF